MKTPEVIHIGNLLHQLDELLINLLENLSPEDWEKQTLAPQWNVKDVAVHLLDGNLRTLSMLRDDYFGEVPENVNTYTEMVGFLNQLNADWVKATKRLSPKVIVDLLKISGKEYCDFILTLDPNEKAAFSVGWAGESESLNWFHIAREYTEKWHHQQQIRLAISEDHLLLEEQYFMPYLNTSVRGLPHHYRTTKGEQGDLIQFIFEGQSKKNWFLHYHSETWQLYSEIHEEPNCVVVIPDEIAWRIFTKGIKKEEAMERSEIHGKQEIGANFFDMIAIMG